MENRIGVALFGVGRAGTIHFQNLVRNHRVCLRYVVEKDLKAAQNLVARFNQQASTRVVEAGDTKQVLLDSSVAAVLVCTPTFEHEDLIRQALEHGKAVFCEKPVSEQAESTQLCYDLADEVKKPLFCAYNKRFDPSLRLLRQRVLDGEVGKVHVMKMCYRDCPLPSMEYLRISGGIFHDCAVHDIDLICWILKEYPSSVFTQAHAHNKDIRDMGDVDTVAIVMKFPSGVMATIDLSRLSTYGYDQRLEIFGSEGMLMSGAQYTDGLISYGKAGTKKAQLKYSFPQRYAESFVAEIDHFLDVVEGKQDLQIQKVDTVKCTLIASACQESHRTGQPVTLTLNQ